MSKYRKKIEISNILRKLKHHQYVLSNIAFSRNSAINGRSPPCYLLSSAGYMQEKKLTAKQYLKLYPDRYVMLTYEFGEPIFIAPLKDLQIQVTPNKSEAETWTELDNTPTKLEYHKTVTRYKRLVFEKITG